MKWTAEADAHLLLKIIEIQEVKPDYARVADAWQYGDEKPTPKAISERLVRLKRQARERDANPGDGGSSSLPATPKKPRVNKSANTPKTLKTPGTQKRKRAVLAYSTAAPLLESNTNGSTELGGDQGSSAHNDDSVAIKEEGSSSPKKSKRIDGNDEDSERNSINQAFPSFFDDTNDNFLESEHKSTPSEHNDMW